MARSKNPDNEQMAILTGAEDDPDMALSSILTRGAENVDGKPGVIFSCGYRMAPDKITDDTPYEQRHKDEEYIATTKEKAMAYFEEKLDCLLKAISDDDGDEDAE